MTQEVELHNDDFIQIEIAKLEKEIERSDKKIEKLNIIKEEADKEIEALKAKKEDIKSSIQQMYEKSTDEIEQQKLAYLHDQNQAKIYRKRAIRGSQLRKKLSPGKNRDPWRMAQTLNSIEDIDILSVIPLPYIREFAARHSSVSIDILYRLADDINRDVYATAIQNPIMPLEKLFELSSKYKNLLFILRNPAASTELILKILEDADKLQPEQKQILHSEAYASRSCPIWLSVSAWKYEVKSDNMNSIEYRLKQRYLDNSYRGSDYDMFKQLLGKELYNKYYLDNRSALKQDLKELNDYISTMEDEEEKYLMNKKMKKIVELVSAGFLS